MMRILSVNKFYYLHGGSERYMFDLNRLLENGGNEIVHFAMQHEKNFPSPFSDYFVDQLDFFETSSILQKVQSAGRVIYSFEAQKKLSRLLVDTKPALAHLHNIAHQLSPSIIHALKSQSIPIVQTLHDYKLVCPTYTLYTNEHVCEKCLLGNYYHVVTNRCNRGSLLASLTNMLEMYIHSFLKSYEHIDTFISPSKFLLNKIVEGGVDATKIHHVPLFLDTTQFPPKYEHNGYLLFFGQLIAVKGLGTVLDALKRMKGVRLIVAGRGQQESQFRQIAEKLNLNVDFVGFQSGDALRELVSGAMAIVVPSLWYENQPFAILESFAYGKPVIGSNIGGIPELIDDYRNGLLFEPGNADALADKLQWVVDNENRLADMGHSGRQKIEEQFSPSVHYQRIHEIYQSLV